VEYIRVTLKGTGTVRLSRQGGLFWLVAHQTLIIDSPGLVLQGLNPGNDATMVGLVGSDAKLELRNGTIRGNSRGGVYVEIGSFIMSGGEISGNSRIDDGFGGGVHVEDGSFIMSGGKIKGNSARSGGGVSVSFGSFTMSGGEISGNSTDDGFGGGGVFVIGDGTFSKSGGIIYGYDSGDSSNPLWNKAHDGDPAYGHAVWFLKDMYNQYYRDTTLDTSGGGNISTGDTLPTTGTLNNWTKK
jgi:hypothetical protein